MQTGCVRSARSGKGEPMLNHVLLFAHILSVAVWLGGSFVLGLLMSRAEKSDNPAVTEAIGNAAPALGLMVFMPASIITLVSGAWLVARSGWSFGEPFVSVGMTVILISMLIGPLYLTPMSKRLKAAIAEHGPAHDSVAALGRRIKMGSTLIQVLIVVATWMMVAKPGS